MAHALSCTKVLFCAAVLVLASCGKGPPPPPPPTTLKGTVGAADDVNPDPSNAASPVVIRLYELKSQSAFARADFFSLWDADQATLGPDLKAREDFHLPPGEIVKIAKTLDPDTHVIGVIAGYRAIEDATWRATAPVTANHANAITVRAGRNVVTLTIAPQ